MEDIVSISEEEKSTPRPKHTAPKAQFINNSISELASTDPDWSVGDNGKDKDKDEDKDKLGSMDLGTVESPLQQKSKAKSSKQKKDDEGKMKNLRAAIFQGCARKQPVVRHTRG
jgi:hypothetical protein